MWYGITLVIGLIILIIALFILKERIQFLKQGEKATATVVDILRIKDSEGDTFKPIFKFKTNSNQEIIYDTYFSSSPPGWKMGDEATVVYDSHNPEKAKILTYFGSFGVVIILLSISLPLITIGGGYYIAQKVFSTL
jgi:hypothetical protein